MNYIYRRLKHWKLKENIFNVYQLINFKVPVINLLYVNINIIYENNYIFPNKIISEKNGIFTLLKIILMSGLIDNRLVLLFALAFNLIQHVGFVELCKGNLSSHRYAVGKARHILIAFSDNCVSYSLILYQNSTYGNFIMVIFNVVSKPIKSFVPLTLKTLVYFSLCFCLFVF